MTVPEPNETEHLLYQAAAGDTRAAEQLVEQFRSRLRTMVAVHLDDRVAARVDPSDVVQEVMVDAHRKLPAYLAQRQLPFYPWLWQIAWDHVIQAHRKHLHAQARSVLREQPLDLMLSSHSTWQLANCARRRRAGTGGSGGRELAIQVRDALAQLQLLDRQVLVLRYLEQLSAVDTAAVLGISEEAVRSRQRRALERFTSLLENHDSDLK